MQSILAKARTTLSPTEQFILVVVALSPVAWVPRFVEPSIPRIALALALLPLGSGYLVTRARRGDKASMLAIGLVGVGVVSALLSPAPLHSLFGSSQSWIGVLGFATALAWWACGRELSPAGRRWVVPALTLGAVWNVLLALVQVVAQVGSAAEFATPGRAEATMHNPVNFGAFMAGITACWLARRRSDSTSAAILVVLSFGAGLAGGRAVAASVLMVAVWATLRRTSRRAAFTNLFVTAFGFVSATVLVTAMSTAQSIGDRAGKTSGVGERLAIWRVGLDAFIERPLFGWGPANFELASERQFDLAYTQDHLLPGDTLLRWIDFHNVVLNVLVGFGLVGLLLAIGFVLYSCRGVQDPVFFAGVFAIAANWMLEPMTIHTLPVALILFGAAGAREIRPNVRLDPAEAEVPVAATDSTHSRDRSLVAVGCLAGLLLLSSTFLIDYGLRTANLSLASAVARIGYSDQFIDDQISQAYTSLAQVQPDRSADLLERGESIAERLARRYPTVYSYERLGEIQFIAGDLEAAEQRERDALDLQPCHPVANTRLLLLAELSNDAKTFDEQMQKLCVIGTTRCDPGAGIDDE